MTHTAPVALAATSHLDVVARARRPEAGRTLQPVSARGAELGHRPPDPASPGLLVAGTIALVGALRVRRRLGA
jgi:hypothetical protein